MSYCSPPCRLLEEHWRDHPSLLVRAAEDAGLRALPKLIMSVCLRKVSPWMDICAFYVLVSRVRKMNGLRLLTMAAQA